MRDRLLADLAKRHRLDLIALEAPAGYGRSVLLRQAVARGPACAEDRDLLYVCGPDDAEPGRLASALLSSLAGGSPVDAAAVAETAEGARAVADSLVRAVGHTALIIDDVERSGAAGASLCGALVDRLPERAHLVLSGRRLPRLGVARRIAAGTGLSIGRDELALRPDEVAQLAEAAAMAVPADLELMSWPAAAGLVVVQGRPDLVADYVIETVLEEASPKVARSLAAVAAVEGCPAPWLFDVLAVVGGSDERDDLGPAGLSGGFEDPIRDLGRMPLVDTADGGCWPHPLWAEVTSGMLTRDERSRVVLVKTRALVDVGALNDAGRLAMRTRHEVALVVVVRAALASQPPAASLADLQAWLESGLLPADSAESRWLAGVVGVLLGDGSDTSRTLLEQARRAFESLADSDGEVGVLLGLGLVARARGDLAAIGPLLQRAQVLAEGGNLASQGLVALGNAVAAQLKGEPQAAIAALDRVPPGAFVGDWAAQALMVRGTNLLLAGHVRRSIEALATATGVGSAASRAVAHDLLATARWNAGDQIGALGDAGTAEALDAANGAPAHLDVVRMAKACLLAAAGQRTAAAAAVERIRRSTPVSTSTEAGALASMAEVLIAADRGDLDLARSLLRATPASDRSVRSTVWRAALETALLPDRRSAWAAWAGGDLARRRAVAAGEAAAVYLGGGPAGGDEHRPFLPARWCAGVSPTVWIKLSGGARVERDFEPVDHPAWGRARVRELCLHLALVEDRSRDAIAAALWPDRSEKAASQNLRVTLTHLLDVIDPERKPAGGSAFIFDGEGRLAFSHDAGLRIDLWELEGHATATLATPSHQGSTILAHARRLLEVRGGPLLGGAITGEWLEPHRRRLDDLVVTAALRGGAQALASGDHGLAEGLGTLALEVDPWSERAQLLVAEGRLAAGDLEGARRILVHTFDMLDDLGATPVPATTVLARRVGLSRHVIARLGLTSRGDSR